MLEKNFRLTISCIVVSLLYIGVALASTQSYTVENTLLNQVVNGEQDFGDLVFVEGQPNSTFYNQTNYSALNLEQYDIMRWLGSNSIRITSPSNKITVLVAGSQFYFTETGVHTYESLLNSSLTGTIFVATASLEPITLQVTEEPRGVAVTFSKNNFLLVDEEVINVSIDVDDDVETGEYRLFYKINNKEYSKSFVVKENKQWEWITSAIESEKTVKNGDSAYLGRIELVNTGNVDLEITTTKSGNGTNLITAPQVQTLYRKNNLFLDFNIQVPTVQDAGTYKPIIVVTGDGTTRRYNLTIDVVDAIVPVIEEINFSSDRVYVKNKISVYANDNNEVANVTLDYNGTKVTLKKDNNLFTTEIEFRLLTMYIFNFCAVDNDGNEVCEVVKKRFEQYDIIEGYQRVLKIPAVKIGKYSQTALFNITDTPIGGLNLKIQSIDTLSNRPSNNTVLRVVSNGGSIQKFVEDQVTILDKGEYMIEMKSDFVEDYEIILSMHLQEQYVPKQDITIKSSFKSYDVPNDFEKVLDADRKVVCKVKNTGDLDSSVYDCNFELPITIKPEDLSIPTTVAERDLWRDEAQDVQDDFDKHKKNTAWIITGFVALLLLVSVYGWYMMNMYPYVRIKHGKSEKD